MAKLLMAHASTHGARRTQAAWANLICQFKKKIPSSYAKICGETKFQLPEYPQSGLKATGVEEREKERAKISVNNGQVNAWTNLKYGIKIPHWFRCYWEDNC